MISEHRDYGSCAKIFPCKFKCLERPGDDHENLAMMRNLTDQINVIESDDAISEAFGKLKASLENAGLIIDDADMFIAACALVHGLTMVTNNTKHFKRIKELKLDNWM